MRKLNMWSVCLVLGIVTAATAQNTVTFDNQSGEPALVKLVGPISRQIEVPSNMKQSVEAAAGRYTIKVRYGTPGKYRYTKGDEFEVKETSTTRSRITITLHKVVAGNYDSRPISEEEFGKLDAKKLSVEETGKTQPATKAAMSPSSKPLSGSPKLYPVSQDGRWGYIDRTGRLVLPPKYEFASGFREGLAGVKTDGKWGFIDETGSFVITPRFGWVGDFSEGLAPVRTSSSGFDIMVAGDYSWIRERGGLRGFIDKTGKLVIPEKFEATSRTSFQEGLALVSEYKQNSILTQTGNTASRLSVVYSYVDTKGEKVFSAGEYPLQGEAPGAFATGKAPILFNGRWSFVDKKGNRVFREVYDGARSFGEGFAGVKVGQKWGWIDSTGKIVVNPQFSDVGIFSCGLIKVVVDDKSGFADKTGKLVIPAIFDDAADFVDELAIIAVGGKRGYIDTMGKYLWSPSK